MALKVTENKSVWVLMAGVIAVAIAGVTKLIQNQTEKAKAKKEGR